jgi:hypothetical protein
LANWKKSLQGAQVVSMFAGSMGLVWPWAASDVVSAAQKRTAASGPIEECIGAPSFSRGGELSNENYG